MGKITIRHVAEVAGVSTMTVSRVLNNRPDVSPETRQRILQVIDDLGYAPNAIARSLIQGRSNTLGVVCTGVEYYGPSHTLVGIERQANELGYSLLLCLLHNPEMDRGEKALSSLLAQQVEGILWAVPEIGDNREWLCDQIRGLSTPVVFLDMECRTSTMTVDIDNHQGGRLATEHLLAQGYRRIGIITGPPTWWSARQRELGWRDALQAAGVDDVDRLKVNGNWSAASGEVGLYQLLEQSPDLEAVFASNDQMALGILKAAHQAGRRVPQDLAVVGFDDIPEAAYFFPPLTTVRQDLLELGGQAVHLLDRISEARRAGETSQPEVGWIQPELIVRSSSTTSFPTTKADFPPG